MCEDCMYCELGCSDTGGCDNYITLEDYILKGKMTYYNEYYEMIEKENSNLGHDEYYNSF